MRYLIARTYVNIKWVKIFKYCYHEQIAFMICFIKLSSCILIVINEFQYDNFCNCIVVALKINDNNIILLHIK